MPAIACQEADLTLHAASGSDWALLECAYPLQDTVLLGLTDTQTLDSGSCQNHTTIIGSYTPSSMNSRNSLLLQSLTLTKVQHEWV